jgi:hypothetical protein
MTPIPAFAILIDATHIRSDSMSNPTTSPPWPFPWMILRQLQQPSREDGTPEHVAELELADVGGIGLRRVEIKARLQIDPPLPVEQKAAELEVLKRVRDALDKQIATIEKAMQSP